MDEDVPICIPYCNPDHLDIIPAQQKKRGYQKGFIVTNANCSTTGLVVALKPLLDAFGIEKVLVFTMQALSGAGI
jgi:aspartate-semialdehyde dehydrogenase